jgi:excisionase family DNA binding protein
VTEQLYTVGQVADMLHLTKRTILTYIKDGKLEASRTGRKFLISETTIKNYLKS